MDTTSGSINIIFPPRKDIIGNSSQARVYRWLLPVTNIFVTAARNNDHLGRQQDQKKQTSPSTRSPEASSATTSPTSSRTWPLTNGILLLLHRSAVIKMSISKSKKRTKDTEPPENQDTHPSADQDTEQGSSTTLSSLSSSRSPRYIACCSNYWYNNDSNSND